MTIRWIKPLFLALAITVVLASSAMAVPVNYGTGIHHWVKSCDLGNGTGTTEYVGAHSCPPYVVLPPNCHCTMTTYDFPVDNPYPYFRVVTGTDGNDPGHVHVIIDEFQSIQCGLTVASDDNDEDGVCGAPFLTTAADRVNPNLQKLIESLAGDIEKVTGTPVRSFTYEYAEPLK
jgi:hypothetical protein